MVRAGEPARVSMSEDFQLIGGQAGNLSCAHGIDLSGCQCHHLVSRQRLHLSGCQVLDGRVGERSNGRGAELLQCSLINSADLSAAEGVQS